MKKALSTLSCLSLALLYALILSAYSVPASQEQVHFSKPVDTKEVLHGPEFHADLFCQLASGGGTHSLFPPSSTGPLKHSFNPIFVYSGVVERILFHAFSRYRFYAQHVLLCARQTDLIFPFHYFW